MRITNVVPGEALSSSERLKPWASVMLRAIDSPSPKPAEVPVPR